MTRLSVSLMVKKLSLSNALFVLAIASMLVLIFPDAHAANVASQKAYFGSDYMGIVSPYGDFVLSGEVKTSNVGDLLIGFSMECALWTTTSNDAKKGNGKTTSKSRAAVNVTVYVDGEEAKPGQVVYCDRLQEVHLEFDAGTETIPEDSDDSIILDIFQKTKNANHFNFYYENPGSEVHTVQIWVDAFVEVDGEPDIVKDNTRAAVGKREYQYKHARNR